MHLEGSRGITQLAYEGKDVGRNFAGILVLWEQKMSSQGFVLITVSDISVVFI